MRYFPLGLILCASAAWSSTDIIQNADNTSTSSGNFDSIGIGGADYDIGNDVCRYHTGGLTFAFGKRDKFCEGIKMIRIGMTEGGITHLCKQTAIRDNYPDFTSCQAELRAVYGPPVEALPTEHLDEEKEYREQQEQRIDELEAKLEQAQQPQVIERVDPELQRRLDDFEQRRQKAKRALEGDDK